MRRILWGFRMTKYSVLIGPHTHHAKLLTRTLSMPFSYIQGAFHWGNSGIQRHQLPENRRSFPSVASWCRDSVEARRSRVLPGVQAEIVKDLDKKTREGKTKVE